MSPPDPPDNFLFFYCDKDLNSPTVVQPLEKGGNIIKAVGCWSTQTDMDYDFPVFCVLCSVFCVLSSVFWVLGSVFCVLGSVFCVLGYGFCVLCSGFWVLCSGFWVL